MANMTRVTIKPHTPQNLAWECGCSREDDSAWECNGTCRLNKRCTLRCAKDLFSGPGSTVAVLSSSGTAGLSTYTFEWSENNVLLAKFHSLYSKPPFTTATGSMAFDWIQQELLEYPDTFTHSNLERAALTEAVARLRWVAESPISAIRANSNSDEDTNIEDDDIDIDDVAPYVADIHPWEHWQPDNIIATLSGPAERPLLQRRGSIEQTRLYEFKLTKDNTLTISTRHAEVKAVWYKLAECYKLHRRKGKDFKLTDVFCFLQADDKILTIIPPEEVTALKWCVRIVATHAVKRLEHPTFTVCRDRCSILQCELHIFTLCLRKEIKEQSEMLIRFWFEDEMYAWTFGQMFQVMTTETQTAVDLIVIQERDKKQAGPKYQILNHMSELNVQGIFFCCEGLGYAGKILALPKEATPPLFQQAHIS